MVDSNDLASPHGVDAPGREPLDLDTAGATASTGAMEDDHRIARDDELLDLDPVRLTEGRKHPRVPPFNPPRRRNRNLRQSKAARCAERCPGHTGLGTPSGRPG